MILKSTTTYRATKMTCKELRDNLKDYGYFEFYDPADGTINPIWNSLAWLGLQVHNKTVYVLDEEVNTLELEE